MRVVTGWVSGRGWMVVALAMLMIVLASCRHTSPGNEPARGQSTFASPAEAGNALADAARNDNREQMSEIFGPESGDLLYTGNAAEDKASLAEFASAYGTMNRWRRLENGSQILLVGANNAGFPIPLRKDASGKWYFDTVAGKAELLNRTIGRNELAAIDVCAALADAENEYFAQAHDGVQQYASKFISDPGKQDGLYWPEAPGKPKSPVGPLVAFATDQGARLQSSLHKPFYGYYFGILRTQGPWAHGGVRDYVRSGIMDRGFAFVAYPAQYGVTGVMTFIIDQDRVIYQKDLGKATKDTAPYLTQFSPEPGWTEVSQ
jgi:hypothetical protein